MGCWDMLFWGGVVVAALFAVEMVVKGVVLVVILRQCKTLAEAEETVKRINKGES